MINKLLSEQINLISSRLKIFLIPFLVIFIGVSLQHLGIQPLKLILPIESSDIDSMASIRPLLERKENTFSIKPQSGFIGQSFADETADYNGAKAYAVVDFDSGEVILQKNLQERLPMASITKVMTSVVALDLATLNDVFTVTQEAEDQIPTHIALKKGQELTLEELLLAALLTSANDATHVIKDGIDEKYNDEVFIDAMNAKAQIIGMNNSHFVNPQGFDDSDHYSTVEDLALLSHYALTKYPVIADMVAKDSHFLPESQTHDAAYLNNWNGLLGVYPNISGVKIGNTGRAKKTTVVVSEREGKKLIVVLLGAPGVLERDLWTAQLLDEGFEKTMGLTPIDITEEQLREKYATWKY